MKIMIIGAGEIGRHLALHLSNSHHDTVVIDADEQVVSDLAARIDGKVILGSGSSVDQLLDAGVTECEVFFALTSIDTTNLVACSLAKQLGAKKVICRVHPDLEREACIFDYKEHFGLDHIFSSERLSAIEFVKHIRNPESSFVEDVARGQIELQQLAISEDCPKTGKTLAELKLPSRVRVGAIERNSRVIIPTAHDQILGGDVITLIGDPKRLDQVASELGNRFRKQENPRVIVFGGGAYGVALTQTLAPVTSKIRVFEADRRRAEELGTILSGATVLNIDATSLVELREERVGDCDFFVATTNSDQDNFMTCLQASNLGAKHSLTLIHRADYAGAITEFGSGIGILEAVSPREATARELLRFITTDRYHVIMKLGGAEVIEATAPEGSSVAGRLIKDIDWPKGSLVAAILRGTHTTVPAPDDEILAGDTLYAVVSHRAQRSFLHLLRSA